MKLTVTNLIDSLLKKCETITPDWQSGAIEQYDYESTTHHDMEFEIESEDDDSEIMFQCQVELCCTHEIESEPPSHEIECHSVTYNSITMFIGEDEYEIPTNKQFIQLINKKIELI